MSLAMQSLNGVIPFVETPAGKPDSKSTNVTLPVNSAAEKI